MAKAPILTPQAEDFPRWYQDVLAKAELADNGPVRGTMVIRPYGYGLWERCRPRWTPSSRRGGAENVYLPLFIPESYLRKEAQHVEGFSPRTGGRAPRRRQGAGGTGGGPAHLGDGLRRVHGPGARAVLPGPAAAAQPVGHRCARAIACGCSCAPRSSSAQEGHTAHAT
ncbi:MAG: hypothetical protein R2755_13740 [Acidimicrobiales bacterium]